MKILHHFILYRHNTQHHNTVDNDYGYNTCGHRIVIVITNAAINVYNACGHRIVIVITNAAMNVMLMIARALLNCRDSFFLRSIFIFRVFWQAWFTLIS